MFFATVQNKMHYAVHEHTAAELIYKRVDNEKPFVGMTNFKGNYVTRDDVKIAKNYLTELKDKMVNPEKGTQGKKPEEKTDLLANIIEKINIMYAGKFTEADRVIVETIYDKMVKSGKALKKQAKNNDAQIFEI